MRTLQFKTQQDYDEWLKDNEIFECYDNDNNMLGHIIGTDADMLVSFNLALINVKYGICEITKELTEQQLEQLKKNTLVDVIVISDAMYMTLEQRIIIRRLRKNFEDAKKAGLFMVTNDNANAAFFLNGRHFDKIISDDDLSGEWKEIDGKREFVKYDEHQLSNFVKINFETDCERINGNNEIDFCNWGSCVLPLYARVRH